MRASIILTLFALLLLTISGCRKGHFLLGQHESSSTESRVITLNGQTDLTIENSNGNIVITSSDTAKNIYCKIDKKVKSSESKDDAKAHLSSISINTTKSSSGVRIKVDQPKNDDRGYEIKLGIVMPDNFNYNLNLGNGNVSVNSTTQNLIINIGNGNADADVVLKDKCNVAMSIGNGSIDLKIPGNTNAAVSAKVGNGHIHNNGLSLLNPKSYERILSGTLGNGTGSIYLNIGNGNITLSKK